MCLQIGPIKAFLGYTARSHQLRRGSWWHDPKCAKKHEQKISLNVLWCTIMTFMSTVWPHTIPSLHKKKHIQWRPCERCFSSCELFCSHIFDTVWYLESIGWKVFLVHEMASGECYWTQLDLHSWVVTNNVSRLKSVLILCMLHDSKSWFVSQAMTSVWMNFSVPVVVKSLLQRNRMIVL